MENSNGLRIAVLRAIYDKKGRFGSYTLFRKLKVPMADFMKAIFELDGEKLLGFDGDWLEITDSGKAFLLESRSSKVNTVANGIPSGILRNMRLMPGEPYIPSISRLDLTLRKKIPHGNVRDEGDSYSS